MKYVFDIPPRIFTLSATAVGFLLIDEATSGNEQNALGNWLMQVAQVICTNAAFKQYQNGLINSDNTNSENNNVNDGKDTVQMLRKIVNVLNKEIDNIEKNI